jgi:hypothetical protein
MVGARHDSSTAGAADGGYQSDMQRIDRELAISPFPSLSALLCGFRPLHAAVAGPGIGLPTAALDSNWQNATHTHGGLLRVGYSALSVLVNDAINDVLVTR